MALSCETWDTVPSSLLVGAEWGLLPGSGWRPCSLSPGQEEGRRRAVTLRGTAIPLRKVLDHRGCVSAGLGQSWSLQREGVRCKGLVANATWEESVLLAPGADCLRGRVPGHHRPADSCGPTRRLLGVCLPTGRQTLRTEVPGPSVRKSLARVIAGWLLQMEFTPTEQSGWPH